MKLIFVLVLLISVTFTASKSHMHKSSHKNYKNSPISSDTPAHTALQHVQLKKPKPVKTIAFGPAAKKVNEGINSLGETVNSSVALNSFPFKVKRCDQIILFPATYINDEDDYRVRRKGFVAITAHYTNLFADHDGQKLIQQVVSSTMRSEPHHLLGARGCVRVPGGVRQKNLNICTTSKNFANNLLDVYNDFARCRIGDNLAPISAAVLKELMKLCGISRVTLEGKGAAAAMDKLTNAVNSRNKRIVTAAANKSLKRDGNHLTQKQIAEQKKKLKEFMKRRHKKSPNYFLPSERNNPWEQDRRRYVQYSKLKVPGSRRRLR
jgi:hypothetical protein